VGKVGAVATIVGKCGGLGIGSRIRYLILDKQKHVGCVGWWVGCLSDGLMLFAAFVGRCMLQRSMVWPPAHQAIVCSALLLIVLHNRLWLFRYLLAPSSIVHGCACCAFGAVKGTAAPFYDDNCIMLGQDCCTAA
jgi:hypothetical protein